MVERFCQDIRHVQRRTKCTEATIKDFLETFQKYLECPATLKKLRACDKDRQYRAGIEILSLNGCTKCHQFVYLPKDKRRHCPFVDESSGNVCGGPRFDAKGRPNEVFSK